MSVSKMNDHQSERNPDNLSKRLVNFMENLKINKIILEKLVRKQKSTDLCDFYGNISNYPIWINEYERKIEQRIDYLLDAGRFCKQLRALKSREKVKSHKGELTVEDKVLNENFSVDIIELKPRQTMENNSNNSKIHQI